MSLIESYPSTLPLIHSLADLWAPPERQSLSKWAEDPDNIQLSSEYSARTGNLVLFGWQKEIFDTFTDPTVSETVLCVGTQLVKTLFLQIAIAYVISEDPGPVLMVEYKADDCVAFSKERLAPMLRDCPCLRGKVSDHRGTGGSGAGSTLVSKDFTGGNLSLVSALAPGNLARRSIRYLFCDEIDRYPKSSGKEGDPIALAKERQATFQTRKRTIECCSPTIAGLSNIEKAYNASDGRQPWVVCPSCSTLQLLKFANVWWNKSLSKEHQPSTAQYLCLNPDCPCSTPGQGWDDVTRWMVCDKAQWRAQRPFAGVAGFWISHLYSPWKKLEDIVRHFLRVKGNRDELQVFTNTVLAETWREEGETPNHEILYGRREAYEFETVPSRGLFLTAAVDVQDSPARLEVEVVAWGRNRENWSIDYQVLQIMDVNNQPIPVTSPELWEKLDTDILQKYYPHANGAFLPIMAMGIDTGNRPKPVYLFARRHSQLRYDPTGLHLDSPKTVVPLKGTDDNLRIVASVSKEDVAKKRQGVRIIGIGTICAKQEIYDSLQHIRPVTPPNADTPNPGYYHFPMYELDYFLGLTAEVRVIRGNKVEYEKRSARNEPLDLKVYNRAMASIVGIDRFSESQWQAMEARVGVSKTPALDPIPDLRAGPVSPSLAPPPQPQPQPQSYQQPIPHPNIPRQSGGRPIRGRFSI